MNKQERDALREKHTEVNVTKPEGLPTYCMGCAQDADDRWTEEPWKYSYPCDVIKVLDWAEFLSKELKSISAVWDGE
jgi:hypothetical protein